MRAKPSNIIMNQEKETCVDQCAQTDECEECANTSKFLQILPVFLKNTKSLVQYEKNELLKWRDCQEELNTYVVQSFSEMRAEFLASVQRLYRAREAMRTARCRVCMLRLHRLRGTIQSQVQRYTQPKLETIQALQKRR